MPYRHTLDPMLSRIATVALAWVAGSVIVGPLVGRCLHYLSQPAPRPPQ